MYGDYPETMKKNAGTRIPTFSKLEATQVKGSFDFIGLNHYDSIHVKDMSSNLQKDVRDITEDMAAQLVCAFTLSPILSSYYIAYVNYFPVRVLRSIRIGLRTLICKLIA